MKENLMLCQGKLERILCSRRKWLWCMEGQHAWTETTESPFFSITMYGRIHMTSSIWTVIGFSVNVQNL